jgi:hypothetical protein
MEIMETEMEKYKKMYPEVELPRLLAQDIHTRFKCTKYVSKEISKELIKNNKTL